VQVLTHDQSRRSGRWEKSNVSRGHRLKKKRFSREKKSPLLKEGAGRGEFGVGLDYRRSHPIVQSRSGSQRGGGGL